MIRELGIGQSCEYGADMKTVIDAIKTAGFKHVMLHEKIGELERAIKYAQSVGLKIPFVHLAYDGANDFWSVDEKVRAAAVREKTDAIELCARNGVATVVVHPSRAAKLDKGTKIDVNQGRKSFGEILEFASARRVRVALENLKQIDFPYLDLLLTEYPGFGFCYDCGHAYLHTPGIDLMAMYRDRVIAVHVHDNLGDKCTLPEHDMHLIPFDGVIDFKRVMREIAASDYESVLMQESRRADEKQCCYPKLTTSEWLTLAYERGEKLLTLI